MNALHADYRREGEQIMHFVDGWGVEPFPRGLECARREGERHIENERENQTQIEGGNFAILLPTYKICSRQFKKSNGASYTYLPHSCTHAQKKPNVHVYTHVHSLPHTLHFSCLHTTPYTANTF